MKNTEMTLLDGGMGQELYRRSGKPASPLWSAQVMMDRPELVVELHGDYIAAGADVIGLNAYTATPERLARDADEDLFGPLQAAAVRAAVEARDASDRDVRISGCLPPLVASYRAEMVPDDDTCRNSYNRIVEAQVADVDLFLCETLSTIREARVATAIAKTSGKPVWTALTVDDSDGTKLRSGEPLSDAAAAVIDAGAEAVLINCSIPEAVGQAMPVLASAGAPFGGYANGFTSIEALTPGGTVDVLEARRDLGPDAYADYVARWIADGATVVGGCCEVGPAHIAELRQRI